MKFKGRFKGTTLNHKTGEILTWEKDNMITQVGLNYVSDLFTQTGARPAPITHIAFGSGSTPTTKDMTSLETEIFRASVATKWEPIEGVLTFTGKIPVQSGISANITEAGLFNSESGGVMFDRVVFKPKGIDPDLEFIYEFTLTITA